MKAALILAIVVAFAVAIQGQYVEQQFDAFLNKYGKHYDNVGEYNYRLSVFADNLEKAAAIQAKNPKATFGVTKFSDLTEVEFKKFYLGSTPSLAANNTAPVKTVFTNTPFLPEGPNPTNYNWNSAGVITPVYNQGQCGSCWAFSATETIESYNALAGRGLSTLSMEQITQCDTTCYGCNGGWPYLAYEYVGGTGGIDSYNSYPYTSGNGVTGNCAFNSANVVTTVTAYANLNGEPGIYAQLSSGGPVSVCVDASSWSAYQGGVMTSCGTAVDHCVQAVGYANYGTSDSYWIVRNSWGTDWGYSGYIYIATGSNVCAIGEYPTIVQI
jgi:hypothetical protein